MTEYEITHGLSQDAPGPLEPVEPIAAPTSHPIPTGATGEDDIVQRLRDNADLDAAEDGNPAVIRLEREAANEIERLRRALADAPAAGDAPDAARYRWIAAQKRAWALLGDAFDLPSEHDGFKDLGTSIDAAIAQQKGEA